MNELEQSRVESVIELIKINKLGQDWWPVIVKLSGKYMALPDVTFAEKNEEIVFELRNYEGDISLQTIIDSF